MDDSVKSKLKQAAIAALEKAYAPYSNHPVGSAILSDKGDIVSSGNVENAAYPLGSCAEVGAIAAMVQTGSLKIDTIVVCGPGDAACTPCGGCRQRIAEFGDENTRVLVIKKDGTELLTLTIADLLPYAFTKDNVAEVEEEETE